MILDDQGRYWIYVVPSDPLIPTITYKGQRPTKEEYLEHWGKWVIFDDKQGLDDLANDLDIAVERRWIPQIKYTRSAAPELGLSKPVMAVYCDERERGEVLQFLLVAGAMPYGWEYEREMVEGWKPGGNFMERLIAAEGLSGEEAENYRREVSQQLETWIEYMFGTGEKAKKLRQKTYLKAGFIQSPEDMNLIVTEGEHDLDKSEKISEV